jgi:hypothetical protein
VVDVGLIERRISLVTITFVRHVASRLDLAHCLLPQRNHQNVC